MATRERQPLAKIGLVVFVIAKAQQRVMMGVWVCCPE